ncbi:hypothetical protein BDA96_10G109000 [Sorghum bicolor]|uniref:Uncharacterized protein n=1 Tax=Sorghum bicolor TaxID=4558 RepID=A0A921Q246_SORBI|nr:hypothetical protein BDA96_10G109000 [Sorghum bicolor]
MACDLYMLILYMLGANTVVRCIVFRMRLGMYVLELYHHQLQDDNNGKQSMHIHGHVVRSIISTMKNKKN